MQEIKPHIYFSSHRKDMDLPMIFDFVKQSYWGGHRLYSEQEIAMQNSLNFGLFKNNRQIAYARVMTDNVFFAYLLDVFVVPSERGHGYSKLLLEQIFSFPGLGKIDKWMLATSSAHGLYEKFGFETVKKPTNLMDRMSDRVKKIYR